METANISKVIDNIARNAEKRASAGAEDYTGDDGLLYCGRCHTRKQCSHTLWGKTRIVDCVCKCEKERIGKEEAAEKAAEQRRRRKADAFRNNARAKDMLFSKSTIETDAMRAARDYAANLAEKIETGTGRIFAGDKGTGKTFAATCIVNYALECGYSCKATSFTEIEREMSVPYANKKEIMDRLANYDLIMLDDLGVERNTSYMQQLVYEVIDTLYKAKRALLITTNLTQEELSTRGGDAGRIYERILEDSDIVECNGESLRI